MRFPEDIPSFNASRSGVVAAISGGCWANAFRCLLYLYYQLDPLVLGQAYITSRTGRRLHGLCGHDVQVFGPRRLLVKFKQIFRCHLSGMLQLQDHLCGGMIRCTSYKVWRFGFPDSDRRTVLSVTKRAQLPANQRLRSDPTDPISCDLRKSPVQNWKGLPIPITSHG